MITLLIILLTMAVSFLVMAGLVWIICWGLPLIGVTAIGSWTVAFSWPLALIVWIIYMIFRGIFSTSGKNNS